MSPTYMRWTIKTTSSAQWNQSWWTRVSHRLNQTSSTLLRSACGRTCTRLCAWGAFFFWYLFERVHTCFVVYHTWILRFCSFWLFSPFSHFSYLFMSPASYLCTFLQLPLFIWTMPWMEYLRLRCLEQTTCPLFTSTSTWNCLNAWHF